VKRIATLPLIAMVCLSACGGPSSPTALPGQSLLSFTSHQIPGVSTGARFRVTSETATFTHQPEYEGSIFITVMSNDRRSFWQIALQAPAGQELQVGLYQNGERWTPAPRASRPRFSITGDGATCSDGESGFAIQELAYNGTVRISTGVTVPVLDRLHVLFEQQCRTSSAPGTVGELRFTAKR
jgi:hypothetical protein